jgi:hypothetical protein
VKLYRCDFCGVITEPDTHIEVQIGAIEAHACQQCFHRLKNIMATKDWKPEAGQTLLQAAGKP